MKSITLIPDSNIHTLTISDYSGLLNSDYKNIVKTNFKSFKSASLFNVKQRVKSGQFQTCCSVETGLKVFIFFVGTIITLI